MWSTEASRSGAGSATPCNRGTSTRSREERARALHHAVQALVCDVLEPWEHGTIVRATDFPSYYDFNNVRVESDPGMTISELISFADEALAPLPHRRIDFEDSAAAEPLRAGFETRGWLSERLVWMLLEEPPPETPDIPVEEVSYGDVQELRVAWHFEDFPTLDPSDYLVQAARVAERLGSRVFTVREQGTPVAYAQLDRIGDAAEVAQVFVRADRRGRGIGTAITRAAIAAAGEAEPVWIVADDTGRPKELYQRLGFRPAWTATEFLRLP
jgi:GNAT superfamily N-acetyltransferase